MRKSSIIGGGKFWPGTRKVEPINFVLIFSKKAKSLSILVYLDILHACKPTVSRRILMGCKPVSAALRCYRFSTYNEPLSVTLVILPVIPDVKHKVSSLSGERCDIANLCDLGSVVTQVHPYDGLTQKH